ncbi:MAG: c-type cytochrome, partial [Planctomycetaceae bacterium]|nr:c-type cytochrome [Planctomycetaceae bacterium]
MRWPRTLISFSQLLAAGLFLLAAVQPAGPAFGDELDDEFPPGLFAEYTAGGTTVRRVDSTIAFDWADLSPDSRLPAGPFTAHWESELLVRQDGPHRLHVWVQGKVQVQLDGEDVLTGQRKDAGWLSSDAFEPGFGEHTLEVTFEKTEPAARLGLYWSSSTFPVEPVPAHLLFRDGGDEQLSLVSAGSDQFLAHRCAACHQTPGEEPPLAAPSLVHAGGSLTAGWIVEKLLAPAELTQARKAEKEETNPARMPDFGLTPDQAEAIAAYLTSTAKQPRIDALPRPAADRRTKKTPTQAEEIRAGELLSRSLGCLACHQVNGLGMRNAADGGDLSTVGRKRTAGWLFTWLSRPQDLNSAHRMPVFKLTTVERRQLATYLASLKGDSQPISEPAKARLQDAAVIAEGRQLVQKFRCAACHQLDGMKFTAAGLPGLAAFRAKTEQPGCLAKKANPATGRPAFGERLNTEALLAYLADRPAEAHPRSPSLAGQQLLERKNCLACHDRDQSAGMTSIAGKTARIDADLQQKTQGLIPPSLTAVGDKLKDSALAEAIQGAQKTVRLPWLLVRMPRFQHSETEQAALLAHLISHDRIPPGPPELDVPANGKPPATTRAAAIAAASTGKPASSEVLVAGHTLVGPRGLSCIACHEVGSYKPQNVALGTRGSNLLGLGQRMRPEFYLRWTRSPMRIVPGMEMPSYLKPVPGVLNGEIDTQLLASWSALNDPRFTVPTNPSNVEQFLTVTRGAEARIVRDVFTGEEGSSSGTIPRAFAVGLENSHSFVFDLSRMSLAQWAVGDFARQRTVGKSWYWDLAGVHVARNLDHTPDLALMALSTGSDSPPRTLEPVFRWSTCGELLE